MVEPRQHLERPQQLGRCQFLLRQPVHQKPRQGLLGTEAAGHLREEDEGALHQQAQGAPPEAPRGQARQRRSLAHGVLPLLERKTVQATHHLAELLGGDAGDATVGHRIDQLLGQAVVGVDDDPQPVRRPVVCGLKLLLGHHLPHVDQVRLPLGGEAAQHRTAPLKEAPRPLS